MNEIQSKSILLQYFTALVCEPDSEVFTDQVLYQQMIICFEALGIPQQQTILQLQKAAEEEAELLLKEYARLFIGPFALPTPPYASVYYGEKLLNNEITDAVRRAYEKAGIHFEESSGDLPDHIAVETEFVRYLLSRMDNGATSDEKEDWKAQYESFLNEHYKKWVPKFCLQVEQETNSVYYKTLFKLLAAFVNALK